MARLVVSPRQAVDDLVELCQRPARLSLGSDLHVRPQIFGFLERRERGFDIDEMALVFHAIARDSHREIGELVRKFGPAQRGNDPCVSTIDEAARMLQRDEVVDRGLGERAKRSLSKPGVCTGIVALKFGERLLGGSFELSRVEFELLFRPHEVPDRVHGELDRPGWERALRNQVADLEHRLER